MMSDSRDPPHFKDEEMNVEFALEDRVEFTTDDGDHRKRRRNRTTQSCLNFESRHTSKRKCDRKRPCQRCIQLGLTGLCVYEVDDPLAPALGEDVDEKTRLRNRIAELETLVRELRGKPHPRWAAPENEADPADKWHSRATRSEAKRRATSSGERLDEPDPTHDRRDDLYPSLKTEAKPVPPLYQIQSPSPSGRYTVFTPSDRSHTASYESEHFGDHHRGLNTNNSYPAHSHPAPYDEQHRASLSFHHENHRHQLNDRHYSQHHFSHEAPSHQAFCPCRTSPANGHTFIGLLRQLDHTIVQLGQYTPHPPDTHCLLYRRIVELHTLMQGNDPSDVVGPSYDELSASQSGESDATSPLSASSGPTSFHGSPGVSPTSEWNSLPHAAYNPYFPV